MAMRSVHHLGRLVVGRPQEVAVTVLRHPPRTSEMGFVNPQGAFGLVVGVETEDDANDFTPVCSVRFGVEQSQVGHDMVAIIVGHVLTLRWLIQEIDFAHVHSCEQYDRLHGLLLRIVREDPVCRRLMTMPGVGAVVALNYRVAIDVPTRFSKSRAVGAHVGLTPKRYQSGEVDWSGRISKAGDATLRTSLYEAAQVLMTRVARPSPLRSWAMRLAKRRGRKKAIVALARKIGVILHRMWVDGEAELSTGRGGNTSEAAL